MTGNRAEPDPEAIVLAREALTLAMSEDYRAAWNTVVQIADECGTRGLMTALHGWADTLALHHPVQISTDVPYELAFAGRTGTRVADEVEAEMRWTGQFLSARAALDHAMTSALLRALPWADSEAMSAYVMCVLDSVAFAMTHLDDLVRITEREQRRRT